MEGNRKKRKKVAFIGKGKPRKIPFNIKDKTGKRKRISFIVRD